MKKLIFIILLSCTFLIALPNCATPKSKYRKLNVKTIPPKFHRKKIIVKAVKDKTPEKNLLSVKFATEILRSSLNKDFRVLKGKGISEQDDFIRIRKESAIQFIISATLNKIDKKSSGLKHSATVKMSFKVLDTSADKLIMDFSKWATLTCEDICIKCKDTYIKCSEVYQNKSSIVESTVEAVIDASIKEIVNKMEQQEWVTYIESVKKGKVKIVSGKRSRVAIGEKFNVFGTIRVVDKASGKIRIKPSYKVGSIVITKLIGKDRAIGIITKGDDISEGYEVRSP